MSARAPRRGPPKGGSRQSRRRPTRNHEGAEVAAFRDRRDARVATTAFVLAVAGLAFIAGQAGPGTVVALIAIGPALTAAHAQLELWRLRARRLAEAATAS